MHQRGISLIEIVVVIAILSIALVALGRLGAGAVKSVATDANTQKAVFLAREGIEIMKLSRDQGWTGNIATLTVGTYYYFARSGNWWAVTSSNPGLIDGIFARTVTLNDVQRDANDNIVAGGGSDDPNTKKITAKVSWTQNDGAREAKLESYLMNYLNN